MNKKIAVTRKKMSQDDNYLDEIFEKIVSNIEHDLLDRSHLMNRDELIKAVNEKRKELEDLKKNRYFLILSCEDLEIKDFSATLNDENIKISEGNTLKEISSSLKNDKFLKKIQRTFQTIARELVLDEINFRKISLNFEVLPFINGMNDISKYVMIKNIKIYVDNKVIENDVEFSPFYIVDYKKLLDDIKDLKFEVFPSTFEDVENNTEMNILSVVNVVCNFTNINKEEKNKTKTLTNPDIKNSK